MIDFWLPEWLKSVLLKYSDYTKLSDDDIADLKRRLKRFEVEDPLVSIVLLAWNGEENMTKTIASLVYNDFDFPCELFVVNNNSTDNTQAVLDRIGVRSMIETNQGIAAARRRGLLEARGKYHLCCDSNTLYPPDWIRTMTRKLQKESKRGAACVYGSYSFIPSEGKSRFVMGVYETVNSIIRFFKSRKTETRRVMGFNFCFEKAAALLVNGFVMDKDRSFRNEPGSADYIAGSEDGLMAFNIKKAGYKILFINNRKSRVWTSDRRRLIDGGLIRAIG